MSCSHEKKEFIHRNTLHLSCYISIGSNSPSAKKSNTNSPSSSPNRSTHKTYSSPPTRSNPSIPQTSPTPKSLNPSPDAPNSSPSSSPSPWYVRSDRRTKGAGPLVVGMPSRTEKDVNL